MDTSRTQTASRRPTDVTTTTRPTSGIPASTDAKALVRRMIEAINRQDGAAMRELIHPDYVYGSPGQELRGLAGLEELLAAYRQGFPDLELIIEDIIGEDDRVAMAFTFSGTHTGELMGLPATGKTVSVHGTILSRVLDGKIVEEWELIDLLTMYEQLGVMES